MMKRWQFSPEFREQLLRFEQTCMETEPIPQEVLEKLSVNDSEEQVQRLMPTAAHMEVDNEEVINQEAPTLPDFEISQTVHEVSQLSQGMATSIVDELEAGTLKHESLKEILAEKLMPLLPKLSDSGISCLSNSACHLRNSDLVVLICTHLLLPRLTNTSTSCSRSVLDAMKQLASAFPSEVSTYLLGPLIAGPVDNKQVLTPLLAALSPQNKLLVLRAVVESNVPQLSEWQATLVQATVVPCTDNLLNDKLVALLVSSGPSLSSSAKFGQLLVTVIQKIGPSLSITKREHLSLLVAEHNSVARKIAEKALKSLK